MLPLRDHLPTRTFPFVNYAIIAANVAVFVLQLQGAVTEDLAFVPARLFADPVAGAQTLFTAMFMHASVAHIAGNMLFLWIFGDNVEDALGHLRYLVFYLACGIAAAFAQIAGSPFSLVPMVGASGAISGVLAAYAILYPRSPIAVLNPIPLLWLFWGLFIRLPAWLVILAFFVVNLMNALQPSSAAGGVAFMAHVGGFIAGLALLPLLRKNDRVAHDDWDRFVTPRERRLRQN
jgi:membrane associated rhomboid family serine protease